MRDAPLVSIVTPALNAERFIAQTIASVKSQCYPNIEHIIVTNGSTDRTVAIVRRHQAEDPARIRLVEDGPTELAPKINLGFRLCRGEIVGWLNADDVYLHGAVCAAVAALESDRSVGMVYADYLEIDELGEEIRKIECRPFDLDRLVNEGNCVSQPTVFMQRAVLEEVGGVDERYQLVMDYELWIRVGQVTAVRYVPGTWAGYRRHPAQLTAVAASQVGRELRLASRRHGGRFFSELGYRHSRPLRAMRVLAGKRRVLADSARGLGAKAREPHP